MALELIEHRRGVGHLVPNLFRARAHRARLCVPAAGALVHDDRAEPAPPRPQQQLPCRQVLRLPAERSFGMAPEDVRDPHRRKRARRAVLEPPHHVGGADQDDDQLQARVARQHAIEQQIERLGSDAGARDAADVHVRCAKPRERLRRLEQPVQRARPRRILIEQEAFGLAAAGDEHPVQPVARARHLIASLALAVDVEPRGRAPVAETRPGRSRAGGAGPAAARSTHLDGGSTIARPARRRRRAPAAERRRTPMLVLVTTSSTSAGYGLQPE